MSTFKKQSRKPKPLPVEQAIQHFKRAMSEHGLTVDIGYGSGTYTPAINISVWKKREEKAS